MYANPNFHYTRARLDDTRGGGGGQIVPYARTIISAFYAVVSQSSWLSRPPPPPSSSRTSRRRRRERPKKFHRTRTCRARAPSPGRRKKKRGKKDRHAALTRTRLRVRVRHAVRLMRVRKLATRAQKLLPSLGSAYVRGFRTRLRSGRGGGWRSRVSWRGNERVGWRRAVVRNVRNGRAALTRTYAAYTPRRPPPPPPPPLAHSHPRTPRSGVFELRRCVRRTCGRTRDGRRPGPLAINGIADIQITPREDDGRSRYARRRRCRSRADTGTRLIIFIRGRPYGVAGEA